MEKERRIKVLSLIALVVAILGLTVAFAALSETLTINGTAKVDAATWDVHFENPTCKDLGMEENDECLGYFKDDYFYVEEGAGKANENPTINGTSIENINVTITKPNDGALYYFIIENKGTIDAKLNSINVSPLCTLQSSVDACDWDNDGSVTETDIQKVNDNISFMPVYFDVNNKDFTQIKTGDILKAGERKIIVAFIEYRKVYFQQNELQEKESTELPKKDLTFSDLNVTINYVQAD